MTGGAWKLTAVLLLLMVDLVAIVRSGRLECDFGSPSFWFLAGLVVIVAPLILAAWVNFMKFALQREYGESRWLPYDPRVKRGDSFKVVAGSQFPIGHIEAVGPDFTHLLCYPTWLL